VARMGDRKGTYRDLVGRPGGKRLFGRPRHRWEDIKMDLQGLRWGGGGGLVGLVWSGKGQGGGEFEWGKKPSGSIKRGGIFF